jgi:WhiB family redox-sensing transcriptional regulator
VNWRDQAACLRENPELFVPIGTTGPAIGQLEDAKRVCASCLVRDPCLQWAIDTGVDHGVWGGLDESERRSLKRRAARVRMRAV